MELKDAYKDLARFAAAQTRGATVVFCNGESRPSPNNTGKFMDAESIRQYGGIKEIIEPTILRDWTAEDAKKHLGYGIRHIEAKEGMFCIGSLHCTGQSYFEKSEYATPVPGTDPAKWDWKPCKVEVPASEPPKFNVLTELKVLRHAFSFEFLDRIITALERGK